MTATERELLPHQEVAKAAADTARLLAEYFAPLGEGQGHFGDDDVDYTFCASSLLLKLVRAYGHDQREDACRALLTELEGPYDGDTNSPEVLGDLDVAACGGLAPVNLVRFLPED